jgi:uncharacterized protein
MTCLIVLAAVQITSLWDARKRNQAEAAISTDLGLTQTQVRLSGEGVFFPGGGFASWGNLEEVADTPQNCFCLVGDAFEKIQVYSPLTDRHYVLMPTESAPTMLISGIPMHRIKGTTPDADTKAKVSAIKPVKGLVLDTATGLGYTAIEAAKTAEKVITIELDPVVMEIIQRNPWSSALLNNPRIEQLFGDSFDRVTEFATGSFARIIHDPPMISLAGELYSGEFYQELYRILTHNGILFHYIGDLDSNLGSRVARGAKRRLHDAGFRRVEPRGEAFGLVARK